MTFRRIGCACAVLSVLCVLLIFLFPTFNGPYSAVHGPVTALLSLRAAARIRVGIVLAGLNVVVGGLFPARLTSLATSSYHVFVAGVELDAAGPVHGTALRC
jgi:hypothetical protein